MMEGAAPPPPLPNQMRARKSLLLLPLLVFPTGCLHHGAVTVPRGEDIAKGLARARASSLPSYFAGSRFAGLPLTDVEVDEHGRAFFAYGTCTIPAGQEGGCAVPVQIQNLSFKPSLWRLAVGCHRRPELLHVPTVRHDGLVLFTRRTVVKIYARSPAEDKRVALSLREVRHPRAVLRLLPPPPRSVRSLQASVCR